MPPALDPVETLCALDWGGRGITRLVVAGAMAAAARGLARAQRAVNAPLDALFLRRRSGTVTIGVGDGGNEIGMGRVRVVRNVPNGAKIASVVRTDHLIVAGTSNWGGWGVMAHLGLLVDKDL